MITKIKTLANIGILCMCKAKAKWGKLSKAAKSY